MEMTKPSHSKIGTLTFFLALFAAVLLSSPALAEPDRRVYLVNATQHGQEVVGVCSATATLTAGPGQHPHCIIDDPTAFGLGLPQSPPGTLDLTKEGQFEVALTDGTVLRGTLETVTHLDPARHSYYVYVWQIEKGKK